MPMNNRLMVPRNNWTPKSIPGLALWLDAADSSTISIGTGVSQWSDKSGNGINAVQAVANNQPAYQLSVFNGRNAVYFDGTNDEMAASANAVLNVTEMTMAVVFRRDSDGMSGVVTKSSVGINPNGFGLYTRTGPATWFQGDDGEAAFCTISGAYTNLSLAVIRGTANTQNLRLNGSESSDGAVTSSYAANLPLRLGVRRAGTEFFVGHICEVLFWPSVISAASELTLRNWLRAKWGIVAV